jgi:hypothetical protein
MSQILHCCNVHLYQETSVRLAWTGPRPVQFWCPEVLMVAQPVAVALYPAVP